MGTSYKIYIKAERQKGEFVYFKTLVIIIKKYE